MLKGSVRFADSGDAGLFGDVSAPVLSSEEPSLCRAQNDIAFGPSFGEKMPSDVAGRNGEFDQAEHVAVIMSDMSSLSSFSEAVFFRSVGCDAAGAGSGSSSSSGTISFGAIFPPFFTGLCRGNEVVSRIFCGRRWKLWEHSPKHFAALGAWDETRDVSGQREKDGSFLRQQVRKLR